MATQIRLCQFPLYKIAVIYIN